MIKALCDIAGIEDVMGGQLSASLRKNNVRALTSYEVEIERLEGGEVLMYPAGGTTLEKLNKKTFASKIVSTLFFAGGVIDNDGGTGGYNIQAAFSSAFAAAKKIKENLQQTGIQQKE